jgi:hypothetical protein
MISEDFPAPDETLVETRTRGAPWNRMNKLAIFDPDAVADTGFGPGRHLSQPRGRIVYPRRDELMLFHYKLMGKQRMLDRHREQMTGLGPGDLARGAGVHYSASSEAQLRRWAKIESLAIDVGGPDFDPARKGNNDGRLWWRKSRASRLWRWLRGRGGA